MDHIWEADANPFSNAVRTHISSLRKKLRDRLGYDPIQTKVGQGYRLAGRCRMKKHVPPAAPYHALRRPADPLLPPADPDQ